MTILFSFLAKYFLLIWREKMEFLQIINLKKPLLVIFWFVALFIVSDIGVLIIYGTTIQVTIFGVSSQTFDLIRKID
jgi:hypothetical protein